MLRWSEDTRGSPYRQRSDRRAAMRTLQCNMNPVLVFQSFVEAQRCGTVEMRRTESTGRAKIYREDSVTR